MKTKTHKSKKRIWTIVVLGFAAGISCLTSSSNSFAQQQDNFSSQSAATTAIQGTQFTNDSNSAGLVFDDVRNFLKAYKLAREGANPVEAFSQEYFLKGTPGLKAYARRQNLTAEKVAQSVRERPAVYESLAGLLDHLQLEEPRIRKALSGFKEIYSDVVYPPVYFLIGSMGAGGLSDPAGILIAAEVYSLRSENDKADSSLYPTLNIPHLVAHELAHIQQARLQGIENYRAIYGERSSLLALAIREGSADFLAELASGNHINQKAHQYGIKHERKLWQAFKTQMNNKDPGDWFFVKPSDPEKPQDLGYFMGYQIVESYYRRAHDKKKAVIEILSVTDYPAFLEQSGYATRFDVGANDESLMQSNSLDS